MKKFLAIVILQGMLISTGVAQQVIGLIHSYESVSPDAVNYSNLNHIIYSHVNPRPNGDLNLDVAYDRFFSMDPYKFATCKKQAIIHGVNLWIAVGGGDQDGIRSARLDSVTSNPIFRAGLVAGLVTFAETEGLYGIVIDWQYPKDSTQKNNHELLLKELDTALSNSLVPNCKIACSVGGEVVGTTNHTQYINNDAFDYVDLVFINAFNFPASYGDNHATYNDAVNSIAGWKAAHSKITSDKVVLGVPLFGINIWRQLMPYWALGETPGDAFYGDFSRGYYYNGVTTVKQKIAHIRSVNGYGILAANVTDDRTDTYSLLQIMDQYCDLGVINGVIELNAEKKSNKICIFPNPSKGQFTVKESLNQVDKIEVYHQVTPSIPITTHYMTSTFHVDQPGVYVVKILFSDGSRDVQLLVVL